MSEFFRRYVDDLLGVGAFRDRYAGFKVRLFPVAELSGVVIGALTGRDLRLYNKTIAALLRGDSIKRVGVEIIDDEPTLYDGAPVLAAARDAGVEEIYANVRYLSITPSETSGTRVIRDALTLTEPEPAANYQRRYIDELIGDPVFRARHPGFHVRLFPISELAHVNINDLSDRDLRIYNKALASLLRGEQTTRIVVELSDESGTPTLAGGDPILLAARDAGVTELMATLRYTSREVVPVWWDSSNEETLEVITTDDDDAIRTDDDLELME